MFLHPHYVGSWFFAGLFPQRMMGGIFFFWDILIFDTLLCILIGGLSCSINKNSSRCQGWWHYHSLWQTSREITPWIWGSHSNGVLWPISCWCGPVIISSCSLLPFHDKIMGLWTFMSLELITLFHIVVRFPELRDALEKLQLNDAALKVNDWRDK